MEHQEKQELNYADKKAVYDWLTQHRSKEKIKDYAEEYKGDRNKRDLQVGKRMPYTQGEKTVPAEKMIINLQKKIVRTSVSFLMGNPPTISANDPENDEVVEVLDVLKKNRLPTKLKKFAESVKSETMGTFIFSMVGEGTERDIKFRIYNHTQGTFTPQYDPYGDLIAFFWEFATEDDTEVLWIFDERQIHIYENQEFSRSEDHGFSKIPVVFLQQDKPEWWDVKELIDRLEMIQSKLAASNNFFAFPILKLKGGIGKNEKGEKETLVDVSDDGKTLLLGYAEKNGQVIEADAEFLQRDPAIDSIQAEVEYLLKFIYAVTQTPDLSFDNVKGIGAISGVALELMFMDAINKARWDEGEYSTVLERCISVIRSGLGTVNNRTEVNEELEFDITFNLSLPRDLKAEVETIMEATGGRPILSRESGVKLSPFTDNASEEIKKLEEQESKGMGSSFNFETQGLLPEQ